MPVAIDAMTFGVEIECIARGSITDTVDVLRAVGINAAAANYSARNAAGQWLVKPDGSLNFGGREIVSPVLTGAAGLATLRTAVEALNRAGHTADRSCGLHVHVGAAGFTPREVAAVWTRYAVMRSDINAMLAPNRARCYNESRITAPAAAIAAFDALPGNVTMDRLAYVLPNGTHRYNALNVSTLTRPGAATFEFRQHQGTVNADRIEMWVRFLRGFVAASCVVANGGTVAPRVVAPVAGNPFIKRASGQARLWDALATGAAMTAVDIAVLLETTPERAVGQLQNMRRNAAGHGAVVHIVTQRGRRGGPTTYRFGNVAAPGVVAAPVTAWGDVYDGIDADVAAYQTARAAHYGRRIAARAA